MAVTFGTSWHSVCRLTVSSAQLDGFMSLYLHTVNCRRKTEVGRLDIQSSSKS